MDAPLPPGNQQVMQHILQQAPLQPVAVGAAQQQQQAQAQKLHPAAAAALQIVAQKAGRQALKDLLKDLSPQDLQAMVLDLLPMTSSEAFLALFEVRFCFASWQELFETAHLDQHPTARRMISTEKIFGRPQQQQMPLQMQQMVDQVVNAVAAALHGDGTGAGVLNDVKNNDNEVEILKEIKEIEILEVVKVSPREESILKDYQQIWETKRVYIQQWVNSHEVFKSADEAERAMEASDREEQREEDVMMVDDDIQILEEPELEAWDSISHSMLVLKDMRKERDEPLPRIDEGEIEIIDLE